MARDGSAAVRLGIVGVVAAVAGAGGLALSGLSQGGPPTHAVGQEAPSDGSADDPPGLIPGPPPPGESLQRWGHEALVVGPTPAGKEPIIFDDGGVPGLAGYVDAEEPDDEGRPGTPLAIGSGRYEAVGDEVTDADGVLLGYDVSGIGLVDLETAQDAGTMDALLAEGEARHRAAQER